MASAQPPIGGRSRGRSRGRAQIPDRLPRVALASCFPWRRFLELPRDLEDVQYWEVITYVRGKPFPSI